MKTRVYCKVCSKNEIVKLKKKFLTYVISLSYLYFFFKYSNGQKTIRFSTFDGKSIEIHYQRYFSPNN